MLPKVQLLTETIMSQEEIAEEEAFYLKNVETDGKLKAFALDLKYFVNKELAAEFKCCECSCVPFSKYVQTCAEQHIVCEICGEQLKESGAGCHFCRKSSRIVMWNFIFCHIYVTLV